MMDSVAYLISNNAKQDAMGQFVPGVETRSEVLIHIASINRAEFFNAGKSDFKPEYVFKTAAINYCGQDEIEYDGKRYAIYRTYNPPDSDEIELYVHRKAGVRNATNG